MDLLEKDDQLTHSSDEELETPSPGEGTETQPAPEADETQAASAEPEAPAEASETAGEEADMEQMSELYEESLRRVQEGEVVKGRIVSFTKEFVMVDIGYKSEGQIPIAEFTNAEGEITAQVGDTVEALLKNREDAEGALMLSKN